MQQANFALKFIVARHVSIVLYGICLTWQAHIKWFYIAIEKLHQHLAQNNARAKNVLCESCIIYRVM